MPTGGNTTTDHRGRTYAYDAENRLDQVFDGATSLLKTLPWGDGTMRYSAEAGLVKRYFFDGDQEVMETDNAAGIEFANNTVIRRYIRLPGSTDEPLLMIDYTQCGALDLTTP